VEEPFLQLVNVQGVNDAIQTEIHTAESTVPEQSVFEIELANVELKHHKSTCIEQIPSELRQGVVQFTMRSINIFFLFAIRRNCLRSGRS
jgi:hypothetical protein